MPFPIVRLARAELRFAPRPWPFALARRAEIDAHFAGLSRDNPHAFNGRVLMLHTFDIEDAVLRELAAATGLTAGDGWREAGWRAVLAGPRLAMLKPVRSPLSADALRARILARRTGEAHPGLADVRIVRGPADLDDMMPEFIK